MTTATMMRDPAIEWPFSLVNKPSRRPAMSVLSELVTQWADGEIET